VSRAAGHSDIDRVRDATDLVGLISEHVALRQRGREYIGLCPFHEDHRPSFAVVTHKGNAFYKCHACGAGGDCFTFVTRLHKMDFPEALRFLAERAGIELTPRAGAPRSDGPTLTDLRNAAQFACEFFQRTLREPVAGLAARDAIANRGIRDEMVERFMIGAAPDGYDGFLKTLRGKSTAIETAASIGLLKRRDDQRVYDAFRNRLIFPICDEVGRPVAFGGRIIDPADSPKYLNSAESRLFQKSRTLFGLHVAKHAIGRSKQAIVTEGYTDVIACHQAGIENVVGTLGTALTREHAHQLSRLCDTVVLVFDGDEAGKRAADRAVQIFFAEPVDVRICVLPDNADPDDLLRQPDGVKRFNDAVERGVDAMRYKLLRMLEQLGEDSGLSARQKHLTTFLGELADLGFGAVQGTRKRFLFTELADLFKLPIREIERAMPRRSARAAVSTNESTSGQTDAAPAPDSLLATAGEPFALSRARRLAERDFLALMLFDPTVALETTILLADGERPVGEAFGVSEFLDPPARRIADVVLPRLRSGEVPTMQQILAAVEADDAHDLASSLYFEGQRMAGADEATFSAALRAAATALRNRIDRELYEQKMIDARLGGVAVDRPETLEELIRQRQMQGDRPAAIAQGIRS
jgi:DNA primase